MNYNQFSNLSCYEEFEIQCTLVGISKINALKEIGHKIDNYYFFVSNDGIFNWFDLKGNHIEDPHVLKILRSEYIPDNITKCIIPNSVTDISYSAFYDCKSLKEITIPNNVIYISDNAFSYCESLTSITIPNNIVNIGTGAFYDCNSLTSIVISDSVKSIGSWAFSYCEALTSITIPKSVTYIGHSAFSFCTALTSITIPDSVKIIGSRIFFNCNSLKEVIFKGKTLEEVKQMDNYPFEIEDKNIIKCEV